MINCLDCQNLSRVERRIAWNLSARTGWEVEYKSLGWCYVCEVKKAKGWKNPEVKKVTLKRCPVRGYIAAENMVLEEFV